MLKPISFFCLLLSTGWLSAASAADNDTLLSVAKPSAYAAASSKSASATTSKPASSKPAALQPAADSSHAPSPKQPAGKTAGSTAEAADTENAVPAAPSPSLTQQLEQAYAAYRSGQEPTAFADLMRVLRQFVSQTNPKVSAAAIIKATPVLTSIGARTLDAGGGRLWLFNRLPEAHEAILQWADTKATVSYVGRRHRLRKVTYSTTWRTASMQLPPTVTVQAAHVLGGEGAHAVVLVGAEQGSSLWLKTYKQTESGWVETASRLDSVPSFLTNNASGKVSFRGLDLILNIGRIVASRAESGQTRNLAESESGTYKFWLHYTEQGYQLMPQLPDEGQFAIIKQFLDALANSRTDIAKALLNDSRLLSIPKYVGLRGPSSSFKVAEMASPPSGAARFRLITGGKDDVIFEVSRIKDRQVIRAIFIAPPDPFLLEKEIASRLPGYDRVASAPPADSEPADKH